MACTIHKKTKIVCIRRKVLKKIDQSHLCCGYIRNTYQQSESGRHLISTQLISLITSYIFAPIKDKWLKHNKNLKVFSYPKPKRYLPTSTFFYREIGIDEMDGPYFYSDSGEYKLDVTYHNRSNIYSVSLDAILSEKDQFEVHEYIAYNQWKYSTKFVKYWQSICHLISLPIPRGAVLLVYDEHPKYILVSWVPTFSERYYYPGYQQRVVICGGKQIDIDYEYNMECCDNLHYIGDIMWYIELGEKHDIITRSESAKQIIFAIRGHQVKRLKEQIIKEQEYKAQQSLKVGLKKIYQNLKLKKYGEVYNFGHQYTGDEWDEYLENKLRTININYTSTGYTKTWTMLIAEGTIVFGHNYFVRTYNNIDKDMVYLSKMKCKFNTNSGYLRIKAIRLKRNINGAVQGLELLEPYEKDHFSLLSVVRDNVLYYMLDYLNAGELNMLKEVSIEFGILCFAKLKNYSYAKLWRELNL